MGLLSVVCSFIIYTTNLCKCERKKNPLIYINRLADAAEDFLPIFTTEGCIKFQLVVNEKKICSFFLIKVTG